MNSVKCKPKQKYVNIKKEYCCILDSMHHIGDTEVGPGETL